MAVIEVTATAIGALLPITNPVGALAAYTGVTDGMDRADIRSQAVRAGAYAFAILAVFTLFGSLVLSALGITLGALQLAGGLVVAHSGFGMLAPGPKLNREEHVDAVTKRDVSFTPMALPLIAGPGAIGVVIALTARNPHWGDRLSVLVAAALISAVTIVMLRYGTPLVTRLGAAGVGAVVRIMGFLILAIGVELVVHGLQALHVV